MSNSDIANLFDELADLLEIQAANPFRVRAYRNASRVVRNWPTSLASFARRGAELPKMPGIGKDLAGKIEEAIRTRTLAMLESLKQGFPPGLTELLKLPGMGPRRVSKLQSALAIRSVSDLEQALAQEKLADVEGFGPKTVERLRAELKLRTGPEKARMYLARSEQVAEPLLSYLREGRVVRRSAVAGSFRRRRETVGDVDLLVSSDDHPAVMRRFLAYEDVARTLSEGTTRSTVILKSGVQVDLRVVDDESYGAALHYFTGSKAHNIAIRSIGMRKGLKINEYGVFRGARRISGRTEEEVFKSVGLPYLEPELREDQGEIEAAQAGTLPNLISIGQIRGDLHAHSKAMAEAAISLGYEYLAVTARGPDARRLNLQLREIDQLNERLSRSSGKFRILKSVEVDILEDGKLDLPDSILSQLDLTVCSVHSHFGLSPKRQLERILKAMEHPSFNILGHPTGLSVDLEKVMTGARERGCFLEINAQPERMDLADRHCKLAKEIGVMVAISTDAHSDHDLSYMKFGVSQARRGWLEAKDVLNTRGWDELRKLL